MDEHVRRLGQELRRHKVLDMQGLQACLHGRSRRSIFRDLVAAGYRTSFTHTGRHYTLADLPDFDEFGLWFRRDVGFSRAGTLKQTVAAQVEATPEGRTHGELRHVLKVRVHNTLLGLVREGLIGREAIGGLHLYVSANAERAAEQVARRRELRAALDEALRVPSAAMRDLGKAVTPAIAALVSELQLDIPVLACHQHFLADLGKDLLEAAHGELRGLFRRSKLRPNLRALVRELGRQLSSDIEQARQDVIKWEATVGCDHHIASGREGMATIS